MVSLMQRDLLFSLMIPKVAGLTGVSPSISAGLRTSTNAKER
jgi:hypothetical protein